MHKTGPYFTVAETCRRLGISRKALRLYEAQGLVSPERTQSEWRVYGPRQIARLHQVLALKRFGFPLNRVAEILNDKVPDISSLLALHEQVVKSELDSLQRAARLLHAARAKLATQGHLSTDDLIFLTKETVVTEKRTHALNHIYEDIAAKHLSAEDRSVLARNGTASLLQPDADWPALHAEAQRLMETGDPTSLEAMDLAKRWMEKVFQATGGDPGLTRRVRDVVRDLNDDPTFQKASMSSNTMMDFIQKAYGAAIEAGIMPKPADA
ncbi:MerR family transcriptional regulator [Asticcacaulis solisilvae]|uniref:MerR family transcriptional regulator n=1 Tax=Asticcacaulis solisilvae TaxID=1217274 RepID=UPI003FD6C859